MRTMMSEFVVIVLGVLVALGLESAWQDRQDRAREASMIRDLAVEFRRNRELLVGDLDRNRARMEAADEWRAAEAAVGTLPADSARAFMTRSFALYRFDPEDGVLRSVMETGGLELVRRDDLRSALSGWPGRVAEARQTALDATNARHLLVRDIWGVIEGSGSELRRELVLTSHVAYRGSVVGQQEWLLQELERILSLLGQAAAD
jgi:hypothetical protein